MDKREKRALKKYYAQIKIYSSGTAKQKRFIIENLRSSVEQFISENDNVTMDIIVDRFGTPLEIAEKNLFFQSDEKLRGGRQIMKTILTVIIAVIVLYILVRVCFMVCAAIGNYLGEIIMVNGHL